VNLSCTAEEQAFAAEIRASIADHLEPPPKHIVSERMLGMPRG
jgi:hypothetical protein